MHDREHQQEAAYQRRFLGKLDAATTLDQAGGVCLDDLPDQGAVGHLRHANLLFFIQAFAPDPNGTPRVQRDQPLIQAQSTPNEREAYIALARRLTASGELSLDDLAFVEQSLQP